MIGAAVVQNGIIFGRLSSSDWWFICWGWLSFSRLKLERSIFRYILTFALGLGLWRSSQISTKSVIIRVGVLVEWWWQYSGMRLGYLVLRFLKIRHRNKILFNLMTKAILLYQITYKHELRFIIATNTEGTILTQS